MFGGVAGDSSCAAIYISPLYLSVAAKASQTIQVNGPPGSQPQAKPLRRALPRRVIFFNGSCLTWPLYKPLICQIDDEYSNASKELAILCDFDMSLRLHAVQRCMWLNPGQKRAWHRKYCSCAHTVPFMVI